MAAEYVVSRAGAGADLPPVADLVAGVEGARVLGVLDAGTALVALTDEARARVQAAHPELRVEPNARYAR